MKPIFSQAQAYVKSVKTGMLTFVLFCSACLIGCGGSDTPDVKTNPTPPGTVGSVIDNDGNVCKTITIGTQTWMAENLRSTRYRTGEFISNLTLATDWKKATFGVYCDYNNDATNGTKYGKLYNWAAVTDSRKIAPTGWHVATEADWTTLITYLKADSAGARMKEAGTTHWSVPNTGATNKSGFTALPGGVRNTDGTFSVINDMGCWWTSTEVDGTNARYWFIYYDRAYARGEYDSKMYGRSIRCVRDN